MLPSLWFFFSCFLSFWSLHLSFYLTSLLLPLPSHLLLYYNSARDSHKHYLTHHSWRGRGKSGLRNPELFSFSRQANRFPGFYFPYECLFLCLILLPNHFLAGHMTKNPGIFKFYPQSCLYHICLDVSVV